VPAPTIAELRTHRYAVPAHFDAEVYQTLRALDRRGVLAPHQLDKILPTLLRFRAQRVPLRGLLSDAHALGTRFSPRHAFYVALARRIGGELFTRDRPLATACEGIVAARLF
jgi:predicted nucleic acid-binding protein